MSDYLTASEYLTERAEETARLATPSEYPTVEVALLKLTASGGDRSAYDADAIEAADAALVVLQGKLDAAEAEANSYIAQRYSLPLSASQISGSPVPAHIRAMTRRRLHGDTVFSTQDKPDPIVTSDERAIGWLKALVKHEVTLGPAETTPSPRPVFVAGPTRIFGRNNDPL